MEKEVVVKKQFSLKLRDFLVGLLVAVLTPILVSVEGVLRTGSLEFDYHKLLVIGLSAGVAYLLKNFFEPTRVFTIEK